MEILNAIFDIYGDKEFDYDGPVFIEREFLSRLKRIASKVSFKLSSESDGQDCLENLRAFIDYKDSELK